MVVRVIHQSIYLDVYEYTSISMNGPDFSAEQANGEVHGGGERQPVKAQPDDGHRRSGQDILPQGQHLFHLHPADRMYRKFFLSFFFIFKLKLTFALDFNFIECKFNKIFENFIFNETHNILQMDI
jgi:hypothetical protein